MVYTEIFKTRFDIFVFQPPSRNRKKRTFLMAMPLRRGGGQDGRAFKEKIFFSDAIKLEGGGD